MNPVIINLASGRHLAGQIRLRESLNRYWGKDVMFFSSEADIGAPSHSENPYAFKPFAFKKAIQSGYTHIFWVDASFFAVRDIAPLFKELYLRKQMFFKIGHITSRWINQNCLNYFGVQRESLTSNQMIMGGFIGLDVSDSKSINFLNKWEAAAVSGAFKGSWQDHRHDQTCASIIIEQLGIEKNLNSIDYAAYIGNGYSQPKETVYFL